MVRAAQDGPRRAHRSGGLTLLAVALDVADLETAVAWARRLGPEVDVMKVGLELFVGGGPPVVAAVRDAAARPVFLDLKLDDIPATVAGAARAAAGLGVAWLTVHTAAGEAACAAAVEAVHDGPRDPPSVLGVTVLTSLGRRELRHTGVVDDVEGVVDRRARLAAAARLDGVVCAGTDQHVVAQAAPALLRVVPGVRLSAADAHDKVRVTTAAAAAAAGAAMVVVGRPITAAADPVAAARALRTELGRR